MDKQCIKKIWYIHTMELLTELKKKEILLYAPTQINFEDIMLCENSHKRTNTAWFHSNEVFKAES